MDPPFGKEHRWPTRRMDEVNSQVPCGRRRLSGRNLAPIPKSPDAQPGNADLEYQLGVALSQSGIDPALDRLSKRTGLTSPEEGCSNLCPIQ